MDLQAGTSGGPTWNLRIGDLVKDAVCGPKVEKGKENRGPAWEPATPLNLDKVNSDYGKRN